MSHGPEYWAGFRARAQLGNPSVPSAAASAARARTEAAKQAAAKKASAKTAAQAQRRAEEKREAERKREIEKSVATAREIHRKALAASERFDEAVRALENVASDPDSDADERGKAKRALEELTKNDQDGAKASSALERIAARAQLDAKIGVQRRGGIVHDGTRMATHVMTPAQARDALNARQGR